MATYSRILAWRIPWTRSLAGHSPQGHTSRTRLKRLGTGQHWKCGPWFSKAWRLDRILRTHRIWPWPSILILRTPRNGPAWEGRTASRGTSFGLMHLADLSTERGGQVGGESILWWGLSGTELLEGAEPFPWSSWMAHLSGKTDRVSPKPLIWSQRIGEVFLAALASFQGCGLTYQTLLRITTSLPVSQDSQDNWFH